MVWLGGLGKDDGARRNAEEWWIHSQELEVAQDKWWQAKVLKMVASESFKNGGKQKLVASKSFKRKAPQAALSNHFWLPLKSFWS